MGFTYFNQNNYPADPYPSANHPKGTIKSSGCGICAIAMIICSLTPHYVDPVAMAEYSIEHGARALEGTDMKVLADAVCADYGLTYTTTNDEEVMLEHLKKGGMVIANIYGDRDGWTGIFSTDGHFVVVATIAEDGSLAILDPGYYSTKFTNIAARRSRVWVSGDFCYCTMDTLSQDTSWCNPSYWLFNSPVKLDNIPDAYAKEALDWALSKSILIGDAKGDYKLHSGVTRQDMLVFLHRLVKLLR
jgi:hypothetical protein